MGGYSFLEREEGDKVLSGALAGSEGWRRKRGFQPSQENLGKPFLSSKVLSRKEGTKLFFLPLLLLFCLYRHIQYSRGSQLHNF